MQILNWNANWDFISYLEEGKDLKEWSHCCSAYRESHTQCSLDGENENWYILSME